MTDILDELDEAWVAAGKPTGVLPRRNLFAEAAAEIRKLRAERAAIVEQCAMVADRYAQIGHDKGAHLVGSAGEDYA